MVNEEKVRIMTQLALDETKRCKEAIEEGGYYRTDYIRVHTMKVLLGVSLSCLLVLGLVALYHMEYLFVNIVKLDYHRLGIAVLVIYIGLMVVCMLGSVVYYSAKYTRSLKQRKAYLSRLKELERFYADSKGGNNG